MKKIIAVLLILSVAVAAFADGSSITFNGLTAIDNRSPAMGGTHVADTSDYFTLLRNPAGLAFSGRHNLVGQTVINVGGPIEEALNMVSDMDDIMGSATDLIAENKLNLGLHIGGPIAFGGTYKNGFGWGFFDQIIVNAVAPSTVIKADMEIDLDLVFGYGHAFDLGKYGKLAVGVSTDIYGQTPYMKVQQNLLSLLSATGDMSDLLSKNMALNATAGFNVNAGLQYEVLDWLSAGLVWNNFVSYAKTSTPKLDMDNLDIGALLVMDKSITEVGKGSLDLGVGFDIPTSWSFGIISDWTAYTDMKDLIGMFKNDPLKRNPILNLGIGTEMTLLKCISARLGISDSYLNAGIGLRLLSFHIDASIYGKELGVEPGATPQMNVALSFGFRK